ncbi:GxxExxY protein [Sorangium sp. So ce1128]
MVRAHSAYPAEQPEFNAKAQRRKGAKRRRGNERESIAKIVVDAAIDVHRSLLGGPGLLETVYEEALAFELESRGLSVVRQETVSLVYKGKRLASDLRLDLFMGDRVTVECKATAAYNPAPRRRETYSITGIL